MMPTIIQEVAQGDNDQVSILMPLGVTLPKTKHFRRLKIGHPQGKLYNLQMIFRRYVSFREGR